MNSIYRFSIFFLLFTFSILKVTHAMESKENFLKALPEELAIEIFGHLSNKDLLYVCNVDRKFYELMANEESFKKIQEKIVAKFFIKLFTLVKNFNQSEQQKEMQLAQLAGEFSKENPRFFILNGSFKNTNEFGHGYELRLSNSSKNTSGNFIGSSRSSVYLCDNQQLEKIVIELGNNIWPRILKDFFIYQDEKIFSSEFNITNKHSFKVCWTGKMDYLSYSPHGDFKDYLNLQIQERFSSDLKNQIFECNQMLQEQTEDFELVPNDKNISLSAALFIVFQIYYIESLNSILI